MSSGIDEQLDRLFHEDIKTDDDLKEALGEKHYVHIVSPPENGMIFGVLVQEGNPDPSAQDIVNWAREHNCRVVALCGYVFVPLRETDNLDACPICMDVAGMHMRNAGE